jgi:flavin-dependent dehydrogenase
LFLKAGKQKKVGVAGGGLAGLIAAITIARSGNEVTLFEKKKYPFHRVCGEYISNETIPFLKRVNLFPEELGPTVISRFQLTSVNGKAAEMELDLGGFGVSRFALDHFLFKMAEQVGVVVHQETEVESILFRDNEFDLKTNRGDQTFDLVIGTFGKRSRLDQSLHRTFFHQRSPYVGVKYHVKRDHPSDLISLHNFKDGYCGISNVEGGKSNVCYLTHRNNLKVYKNIDDMEEAVLYKNPFLKDIFLHSDFLFEKPEVINEISFATKAPVEDHILMAGDAAGMITPLCGNGMAMAIHSAYLVSNWSQLFCTGAINRQELERGYQREWTDTFSTRLWAGRQIQRLFGSELMSNVAVNLARHVKPFAHFLMRNTHGKSF